MGVNYPYLWTDSGKQAEADTLALALATATTHPETKEVFKQLIMLLWAFAESTMDVRSLLSQQKIPIQYVPQAQVDHLRNKDGGKYHACARCMRGTSMGGVYITDYGRNYHSSVQCSGLKRTIRAVKKSQCGGRPACSKCGSGN